MLDLMFVAIVVLFFGLSLGYAAFCDRLVGGWVTGRPADTTGCGFGVS